ncbi:MAG: ferritin-like domain-containing protein [Polyangiaceae bacterium]|jgi:hypothetical protein|nr:ferritin-like domain-containing protein [Polyangiaceae bacterium]MBK8937011.1 ferritin-like domain-containing protein [Polyangiaceae bacterium]
MASAPVLALLRRRWLLVLGLAPAAGCSSYEPAPCEPVGERVGGVEACTDGTFHRAEAVDCAEPGPATGNTCTTDAHCAAEEYCACTPEGGLCSFTACRSDAECEEGFQCVGLYGQGGYFACQTANDECMVDADCGDDGWCSFDGSRRTCEYPCDDCPIDGRPFLVDGENRRAAAAVRVDWCGAPGLARGPLSAGERASLVEHWTRVALMEHASIGAFARLVLQLLSIGAPPELIARATRAMADETRHARIAFGLATSYGAVALGPGTLPIDGALDDTSLATVVRLAIREGCVGETAAALVVREGAERCADPALARVLDGIAEDELEHAELAWATVAWALSIGGDQVRAVVASELRSLARGPVAARREEPLARFGVLSDERFFELRAEAIERLVAPLLRDILRASPRAGQRRAEGSRELRA